jgi:hypothetical protein
MFRPIVLLAAVAALGAGPAFAADEAVASAQTPAQTQVQQPAAPGVRHCWKENPFNEYRDCVNAATRDPNSKIRMA